MTSASRPRLAADDWPLPAGKPPPVAVFAYRRPEHLRWTLEALERCVGFERFTVHLHLDGARTAGDAPGVAATRAVAAAFAKRWGAEVHAREDNGGFRGLAQAITHRLAAEDRLVILEDDTVVSPEFLLYQWQALEHYADDGRVWMVGGSAFGDEAGDPRTLQMLPYMRGWGWGTWRRAWRHYDWDCDGWREWLADAANRRAFDAGGRFYFARMLEEALASPRGTWDVRFYYAMARAGGLALYPRRSMVWNAGFGGGTNFVGPGDGPDLAPVIPAIQGRRTIFAGESPQVPPPWAFPAPAADAADLRRAQQAYARIRWQERLYWLRRR